MDEPSCQRYRPLAPELAVNALVGRERARMLSHLAGCPSCRTTTSDLARTADQLVELLPEAEPPAGFELRVIDAVRPRKAHSRWPVPVLAALLALALLGGGWLFGRSTPPNTPPENDAETGVRTVMYAPLMSNHRQVGQAFLYPDQPSWVYLSLTSDAVPDGTLDCEVVRADGSVVSVGAFPFTHGHAEWGAAAPGTADSIAGAAVTDSQGHMLARADFRPPGSRSDDRGSGPATSGPSVPAPRPVPVGHRPAPPRPAPAVPAHPVGLAPSSAGTRPGGGSGTGQPDADSRPVQDTAHTDRSTGHGSGSGSHSDGQPSGEPHPGGQQNSRSGGQGPGGQGSGGKPGNGQQGGGHGKGQPGGGHGEGQPGKGQQQDRPHEQH